MQLPVSIGDETLRTEKVLVSLKFSVLQVGYFA